MCRRSASRITAVPGHEDYGHRATEPDDGDDSNGFSLEEHGRMFTESPLCDVRPDSVRISLCTRFFHASTFAVRTCSTDEYHKPCY
jgi:hypothetical protein